MTKDEAMKLAMEALKWHKEHLMGVSPDKNTMSDDDYYDKLYDVTESALTALSKAMGDGWMDIESAPKDGTMLLLWHESYPFGAGIGYWSDVNGQFAVGSMKQPSHWQLQPLPPQKKEGA